MDKIIKPKVFTIVLNWNRKKDSLKCLKSLEQQNYKNNIIVFVDNNSNDDSVQAVKKEFPEIKIIQNKKNFGYAKGNNIGIKYALENNADFILILNNDTIVDKKLISKLLEPFKSDGKIVITSSIIIDKNKNKIWSAGGNYSKITGLVFMHKKYQENINFVSGCAMMIKADPLKKVGLFDEKYFLYYEDADLCLRVCEQNYKLKIVNEKLVDHFESKSSGGKYSKNYLYYNFRNYWLCAKKNTSIIYRPTQILSYILWTFYIFTKAILAKRSPFSIYFGLFDALINKYYQRKT